MQEILCNKFRLRSAVKLSALEEARTAVEKSLTGTLSTFSKKFEGYPFGSRVGFASDLRGRPVLADLEENPRCSLLVQRDASDTFVAIVGDAFKVPQTEVAVVRDAYLKKNPEAFWVDFGDFCFIRIEPFRIRLTANIATMAMGASVAEFGKDEFAAAQPDPISSFEAPIAAHMNKDHTDSMIAMVENVFDFKPSSAKLVTLDRYGLRVEVMHDGQIFKLFIPFPRPAEDRKDVKNLIVQLSQADRAAQAAQRPVAGSEE
eukprot:SM000042S15282  [mRNA]  locus=s42:55438:58417:- [translate_table: standard]